MKNLKIEESITMLEVVDILAAKDLRAKLFDFIVKTLDAPFKDIDDIKFWIENPVEYGKEIKRYIKGRIEAIDEEIEAMSKECDCPGCKARRKAEKNKKDKSEKAPITPDFMAEVLSNVFGEKVSVVRPNTSQFSEFLNLLAKEIMPEEENAKGDNGEQPDRDEVKPENTVVVPEGDSLPDPQSPATCKPFSQLSKNQKNGIKKKVNKFVAEGNNDLAFIATSVLGDNPFDSTVKYISNIINNTAKRIADELAATNPSAIDKLEEINKEK